MMDMMIEIINLKVLIVLKKELLVVVTLDVKSAL